MVAGQNPVYLCCEQDLFQIYQILQIIRKNENEKVGNRGLRFPDEKRLAFRNLSSP